jgi:hypothetical protein
MAAVDNLSTKQFNTERQILQQGNLDDLATRVRGVQNMSSNVYKPSFSSDYTQLAYNPSPARAQQYDQEEEDDQDR